MAENIAYGDMSEALDMGKIERAGKMANAEDFIKNLPNGYNTHLGDRATTLSGGQRQRYILYILALELWSLNQFYSRPISHPLLPSHMLPYWLPLYTMWLTTFQWELEVGKGDQVTSEGQSPYYSVMLLLTLQFFNLLCI